MAIEAKSFNKGQAAGKKGMWWKNGEWDDEVAVWWSTGDPLKGICLTIVSYVACPLKAAGSNCHTASMHACMKGCGRIRRKCS